MLLRRLRRAPIASRPWGFTRFVCALIFLATLPPALATERNWTGGNTTWGTSTNWGGTVPGALDNAVFTSSFTTNKQPSLGSTSATLGGIWMSPTIGQN